MEEAKTAGCRSARTGTNCGLSDMTRSSRSAREGGCRVQESCPDEGQTGMEPACVTAGWAVMDSVAIRPRSLGQFDR